MKIRMYMTKSDDFEYNEKDGISYIGYPRRWVENAFVFLAKPINTNNHY